MSHDPLITPDASADYVVGVLRATLENLVGAGRSGLAGASLARELANAEGVLAEVAARGEARERRMARTDAQLTAVHHLNGDPDDHRLDNLALVRMVPS